MNNHFKLRSLLIITLTSTFFFTACQDEGMQDPNITEADEHFTSEEISDRYIVVLNPEAIDYPADFMQRSKVELADYIFRQAEILLQQYGDLNAPMSIDYVYTHSIVGFAGGMSAAAADQMRLDPKVKFVEKDAILSLGKPDGAGKPKDGGSTQPDEEVPWGISRVSGTKSTTYTGSGAAWIIDTGIDPDHPDLNVDNTREYNAFTAGKDAKSTDDGNGHGTHVAGTVGAIDNAIGVVGVAAGVEVIPVKVLDSRGSGSVSGVIAGVDHVAYYGTTGDVANMSLGGGASTSLDNAVVAASNSGVIFCVAAGNDAKFAGNYSPARVIGTNVYTISAFGDGDVFAYFSNYGNPPIKFSAPGVSIYSTYKNGGYATLNGTSMASPHAAGVFLHGTPSTSGTVKNDKDSSPDVIISR